jgi:nitroimidazol reductase NimA-like FMN-containing flavoprotein (pyridoxamine 5'-phosphate oxidase superfamily)
MHDQGLPSHELTVTDRSRTRRKADRARYDWDTVTAILDEALICHVGFALDGRPWVFPTTFARIDDRLYLHGAAANFALKSLAGGAEACVTVTHIDGLVLARSAFHHSMNYRSVMLFGPATAVTDVDEKRSAVLAIVEHMMPGRTADTRLPTDTELRATLVVRVPIDEGSAKVRVGPPIDDEEDMHLPHWAGVVPLSVVTGTPQQDAAQNGVALPDYVSARQSLLDV